jgi:hypothetical protein
MLKSFALRKNGECQDAGGEKQKTGKLHGNGSDILLTEYE